MLDKISAYVDNTATLIYLVLGPDGEIRSANRFAGELLGQDVVGKRLSQVIIDFHEQINPDALVEQRDTEHLLSLASKDGEAVSFLFSFTKDGTNTAVFGQPDYREMARLNRKVIELNQELGNLSREIQKKNAKLQYALEHVKTLQGIVPICMHCHKIRTEKKHWHKLEAYIEEHTHAEFSHSICEECLDKLYPKTENEDDADNRDDIPPSGASPSEP